MHSICFLQIVAKLKSLLLLSFCTQHDGAWLKYARSTPERVACVQVLAVDIVLCSWARHFTLMVPLSTQVYTWVLANLKLGDNPVIYQHPIQGE